MDFREAARRAYLLGWASTSGPLTERVRRGCVVAADLAYEARDDGSDGEGALLATMQLGSLEGAWAGVHDRRDKQRKKWLALIWAAWLAFVKHLDLSGQVQDFRRAAAQADGLPGEHDADTAAARGAATSSLHGQVDHAATDYAALIAVVAQALQDAKAHGRLDALVTAAEKQGHTVDVPKLLADITAGMGDDTASQVEARQWVGRMINGNATDLTRSLMRDWQTGADEQDMLDHARDVISGVAAVDLYTDQALSQAANTGMRYVFQLEDVPLVNFVTAADGRVCARCAAVEDGNPYTVADVPVPGLHPRCRCVIEPAAAMGVRVVDLFKYLA